MASFVWLTVVLFLACSSTIEARRKRPQCTKLHIKECQSLGYNSTIFPNPLTNITSQNTTAEYLKFLPWLAQLNCTQLIDPMPFLCSVYVPKCFPKSKKAPKYVIPPCREFCQKAVGDCPQKAKQIQSQWPVQWPRVLKCSSYPEAGSKSCIKDESLTVVKANKGEKRKENKIVKICCNSGKKAAKKGYQCSLQTLRSSSTTASDLRSLRQVNKCQTPSQVKSFDTCCSKRKEEQQKKKEQKKKRKNKKQNKKKKRQEKKAEKKKLRKEFRKMKKSQRKSG